MATPVRIQLRRQRGKLYVQKISASSRGVKFLVQEVALKSSSIHSPNLKNDIALAVKELMAEDSETPE